ncbi:MAG TPA: thiamine-phosphate kinase [Hyphomicrobiaceae bacterium]|nr:thiamine-phosphate kinase [Hyphomicrobiaceae bacterium]
MSTSADQRLHSEAAIIGEFFAPLCEGDEGAGGLSDDCAVLSPSPGTDLVITTDSLIEGVHFFPGDVPAFKALAVNVSDLIAKGAVPERYLLTIALPEAPTRAFMTRLADGLAQAQRAFSCRLVGGDTDRTPGPFTLTITAIGTLPAGSIVRRNTARPGDIIAVTGTIGDAGLGLALRRDLAGGASAGLARAQVDDLIARFDRPVPRIAAAALVRRYASAAMDISDGLAKDLGRLVAASGIGADVRLDAVPLSKAAHIMCAHGGVRRQDLIASGEDYEVLFTLPSERWAEALALAAECGVPVTQVGVMTQAAGVVWRDDEGKPVRLTTEGWDHF